MPSEQQLALGVAAAAAASAGLAVALGCCGGGAAAEGGEVAEWCNWPWAMLGPTEDAAIRSHVLDRDLDTH